MSNRNYDPYERACKAYARYCQANGLVYQMPNRFRSEVSLKRVTLINVRGDLAVYDIKPSGRLRRRVP